jgi:hypothetical protein
MATDISGSFISGFRVSGSAGAGQPLISGSSASTASLDYIYSDHWVGDVTDVTNVYDGTNALSSSAGIADDISGSFTSGFRIGSGSGVSDQAGYVGDAGLRHRNQTSPNLSLLSSNVGGYWKCTSDLIVPRYGAGGGGTQDAGIKAGGVGGDNCTELYNGSTWSIAATINEGKDSQSGGAGNADAYILFAGNPDQDSSTEFNGSSWAAAGALPSNRRHVHGNGTQNAAVSTGGFPNDARPLTELYNGVSWSEGADMITGRDKHGSAGTQNAHLVVGGSPDSNSTEEYNGSTWATSTASPVSVVKGTAMGSQNDAMAGGNSAVWILYNGTTWTAAASLSTNSDYGRGGSGGGSAAGFITGDYNPNTTGNTYNWYGAAAVTASISKFNTKTFQTEEITITGSAVKIPVFSSTFNVDTKHYGSFDPRTATVALTASYDDEYLGADTVGQLFVTDDGRLNFTYPTASVGYNPDSIDSGSYGTWSTTTGHNTGRVGQATAGTQNAALMFGGSANHTEEWDGVSWSEGNNLIAYRCWLWGAGSVDAMLAGAGYNPGASTCTEEWNGNTWAVGGALIQQRANTDGVGVQNAAVTSGGRSGGTKYNNTEHYDGSSWSVGGALSTTAYTLGMSGTQNAALAAGGNLHGAPTSNDNTCVEVYNGVNWSSATSLTTGRMGGAPVAGTQNSSYAAGGHANPTFTGVTEEYDGSTWSKSGDMIVARGYFKSAGNTSKGIVAGGCNPSTVTCTELYSGGIFHGTLSAWSAGGALITAADYHGATGTQNAGLKAGGYPSANVGRLTEHYDGQTWSAGGSATIGREDTDVIGSQNAALWVGGNTPSTVASSEVYNGIVWDKSADMNTARRYNVGAGTQNAGITFGGFISAASALTEEFNGETWTEVGDMIVNRYRFASGGTQNAAWAAGGVGDASDIAASGSMEEWNGSAWFAGGNIINHREHIGGTGTQNAASIMGGIAGGGGGSACSKTEEYDGITWSESSNMITARICPAGVGSQQAALAVGGGTPVEQTCTEEYQKTHSGKPYLLTKKIKAQE